MAKSSIHIEAGNPGFLSHNDRSRATVNSIFDDEKNEVWNSAKEGFKLYRSELAARTEKYRERTGQKLQKNAITHLSAIVNFNKHHTMSDMRKVARYLENELGTKVFQIAMHRDEGHVDQHGLKHKNYHAHIEFMGLDQDGYSVRKKLTRAMLIQMQSDIAEILGMERGICYAQEQKPRPKRLDTYDFKAAKEREEKEVAAVVKRSAKLISEQIDTRNAKIKDLQAENKRLKAKLKEIGAGRDQYAQLEQTVKELKAKIKAKDLTIEELTEAFAEKERGLKSQIESLKSENNALKQKNEVLDDQTQKTPQIANLKLLKKERIEKIEAEVQKELVAQTVAEIAKDNVKIDLDIAHKRVLKLGGLPGHFATEEIGWGFEAPPPKEEEIEIAKRAYPDLAFDTIDFPMSVAVKTAFTIINERIDNFISKLQKMMNSIGLETIEAYESSLDMQKNTEIDNGKAYDHSQDNSNYLMP